MDNSYTEADQRFDAEQQGRCPKCGRTPEDGCPHCERCGKEGCGGDCQNPYINIYLVDRAYGGPEEGGWWYDAGDPVHSELAEQMTVEERRKRLDELLSGPFSNKGRRSISSVLSDGEYQGQLEDSFAEPYPQTRPHYE
jgi:hypothetical protein